ncbi:DNA-3-methyladenine glycosylase I [Antarcticibacterium arcticum]|uniref:DNA-3-methyladenine glycosylase I n=1 Tax=Antarcticibacterium arcticum TaxID=2585771 RepID=A0A5B8YQL2_9FLAO|nr:DNA-3-methyladenine glycosylase I [Antarcticibacterium arcticum]QED38249.1 DNA-3-methyladenine glycosylase I [Antarcticibacterium arcticum]
MDTLNRCGWCVGDTLYETYHDTEWGVPVLDDEKLFEFLILETFQAGLSWITILRKRENFREAFDGFNYKKIADYSEGKIKELLQNSGIIRNKLKVRATVTNARAFMEVQKEFGSFSNYIWDFVGKKPIHNKVTNYKEAPPTTAISDALSKDLKKRGFKFVGSTVMYAHMQATGMVNDHEVTCYRYNEVKKIEI